MFILCVCGCVCECIRSRVRISQMAIMPLFNISTHRMDIDDDDDDEKTRVDLKKANELCAHLTLTLIIVVKLFGLPQFVHLRCIAFIFAPLAHCHEVKLS